MQAQNSGNIKNLSMHNTNVKENAQRGVVIHGATSGSIEYAVMGRNTIAYNGWDGIQSNDDTTGTFLVDIGGASVGSAGNNSIHGNGTSNPATYRDMRLDLDGGNVSAQGNWWGQAGGPVAGQIISEGACPNCGTADASNALDQDPNL